MSAYTKCISMYLNISKVWEYTNLLNVADNSNYSEENTFEAIHPCVNCSLWPLFTVLVCYSNVCCCQVVWQFRTLGIKIFLFHISINLFLSWLTLLRNKLMHISLFFMNACQLRNKFILMWNKNIFIPNVRICQIPW